MQADLAGARARSIASRGVFAGFEEGLRLLFDGTRFLRRESSLWPLAIVPVFLSLV